MIVPGVTRRTTSRRTTDLGPRFFASAGILGLLAHGDPMAEADQALEVVVGPFHRHAAHGNVLPLVLPPLGEHDSERPARDFRVLEEQFVEVAHPVEQQAVRIGGLDLHVLRHHRRDAGLLHGGRGGIRRGCLGGLVGGLGRHLPCVAKPESPFILVIRSEGRMWTSLEERATYALRSHPPLETPRTKKETISHDRRSAPDPPQTPDLHRPGGAAVPRPWPPRQARSRADQAHGDPARSVAGLFAGRRGAGAGDRREPVLGLRLHHPVQHGRGDLERHRDPRSRQSRRARLEAGDGGQSGSLQALRRCGFHRSRGRHGGCGRLHQLRALSRALLRRHQPRGHQGAGMLHHRGAPAGAHGHSRLP